MLHFEFLFSTFLPSYWTKHVLRRLVPLNIPCKYTMCHVFSNTGSSIFSTRILMFKQRKKNLRHCNCTIPPVLLPLLKQSRGEQWVKQQHKLFGHQEDSNTRFLFKIDFNLADESYDKKYMVQGCVHKMLYDVIFFNLENCDVCVNN